MGHNDIEFREIPKTNEKLKRNMEIHYSHPKGFVGRSVCFAIYYNNICYGHIVAGSATLHLPGRNEFFKDIPLNNIINNTFYHIEKINDTYPIRNFTVECLKIFRNISPKFWKFKYGDDVVGFETLIELPRTGEIYKRDNWTYVGTTKGFSCKRVAGQGTDSWGGKRIWNKNIEDLKPKLVFCKYANS
jgi:hypothetical protein